MAEVTGSFTIVVVASTPPPNPLAITPSSGALPAEVEGQPVPAAPFATVSGGLPPYSYAITGLPAGVTATESPSADGVAGDVDLALTGAPNAGDAAGSPYTVAVVVTDSATPASTASLRRRVA